MIDAIGHSRHMIRACAVAVLVLNSAGVACSDGEANASKEYCELAVSATRGQLDFSDASQFSSLVQHPGLPDRFRAAMTAAAENARVRTAAGNGWSNDDMVGVVNTMCGLDLPSITMVP
jgi:hypothetical protein